MRMGDWQHADATASHGPNQWSSRTCRASCQSSCPSGLGSWMGITQLKAMCTPRRTCRRLRVRCSLTSSCRAEAALKRPP